MTERPYLGRDSSEYPREGDYNLDPFAAMQKMGSGTLDVVRMLILDAPGNKKKKEPPKESLLERLQREQGEKPGESVSIPVWERGSRVNAVTEPYRIGDKKQNPKK